jgi:hypothetical protein
MLPGEMISTAGGPIKESAQQRWGGSVLLGSSLEYFTHSGEAHIFVSDELVLWCRSSDSKDLVVNGGVKYMVIDNGDWGVEVCWMKGKQRICIS